MVPNRRHGIGCGVKVLRQHSLSESCVNTRTVDCQCGYGDTVAALSTLILRAPVAFVSSMDRTESNNARVVLLSREGM